MKLKIKVRNIDGFSEIPSIVNKGEWIDLRANTWMQFKAPQSGVLKRTKDGSYRNVTFNNYMIPLGIAMKLPEGFEAIIAPRSSTFKNFGIIQSNSIGIIDNSYSGNNDQWMFSAIALKEGKVNCGDRICQFRIQLSQKATMWQKIKWFFYSGIKFEEVQSLNVTDRGGFGSTGIN